MKFAETDLPNEIIHALQKKKLVVFAGTGVSMGEPANLPSYDGLASKIAQRTGENYDKESEEPEVFLDRRKKENKNVHIITHSIIDSSNAQPTPLHRNLLKIFQTADSVRLITTNYDMLFREAAKELVESGFFSQIPKIHSFPNIPLGSEFSGLVHLHGSLKAGPSSFILTAEDFSRHYIGHGRCSEFLYDMFEEYVTLFVGYSHNDTIMRYLARGLPRSKNPSRFLLISKVEWERKKETGQFTGLGLDPITYPKEEESHENLRDCFDEFSRYISRGARETKSKIQKIVSQSPENLSSEEKDRLTWVVSNSKTVHYFTATAGADWVFWLKNQGVLDPLFEQGELKKHEKALSNWIARKIADDSTPRLFALMNDVNSGKALNKVFAYRIFVYLKQSDDRELLNRWITFLPIEDLFPNRQSSTMEASTKILIENCTQNRAFKAIPQLFKVLTKPFVSINSRDSSLLTKNKSEEENSIENILTNFGFRFSYNKTWKDLWNEQIKPNFENLADELWRVFFENLRHFFDLHSQWDEDYTKRYSISEQRSSNESSSYNIYDPPDFLIKGLRDILEFYLKHEPKKAETQIDSLANEDFTVFQRLAVHGVGFSSDKSSDEKLKWLANTGFLLNKHLQLHPEAFRLIDEEFQVVSESVKNQLAENIKGVVESRIEQASSEEEIDWLISKEIDLLYWLNEKKESTPKIGKLLLEARKEDSDYEPKENVVSKPDVEVSAEWVAPKDNDFSKQKLLNLEPKIFLEDYQNSKKEGVKGSQLRGLREGINKITEENFDWSLRLAKSLKDKTSWDSVLWDPLIRGWRELQFSEDELSSLLSILNHDSLIRHQKDTLTHFLTGIVEEKGNKLPEEQYKKADKLANTIWVYLEKEKETGERFLDSQDPWVSARESTAGDVTLFWLKAISNLIKYDKSETKEIPEPYKQRISHIATSDSEAARVGQILLGRNIGFLFNLDPAWVQENMIPLFDIDGSYNCARSVWMGYLRSSGINLSVVPHLENYYKKLFSGIDKFFQEEKYVDRFTSHVALMSIHHFNEPLNHWIMPFVSQTTEKHPTKFAQKLKEKLKNLDSNEVKKIWDCWLEDYWSKRTQDNPINFSRIEATAMGELVFELKPVFGDAVAKFIEGPTPDLERDDLLYYLKNSDLPKEKPNTTIQFLIHTTSDPDSLKPILCSWVEEIAEKIIEQGVKQSKVKLLLDNLIRAGCQDLQ